jgi:RNA polymerase sigma factor (sigma-70 family)
VPEDKLLERFVVERDEAAFEAIVCRHGPMVVGVCQRLLGDSHDVEDAFQATFLVFVRKAREVRSGRLLGPWLYGVAHRVAIRARANAARQGKLRDLRAASEPAVSPHDSVERRDLAAVLDDEVSRLPERYRRAVVLCDFQGLTQEEAARRLGSPIGTVKSRLARAHDRLRSRLARRGLALTAGALAGSLSSRTAVASIPSSLVQATVRLSRPIRDGAGWMVGSVSPSVALLMKGTLVTMFSTKLLKVAAAGLLAAGFLAVGAALFSQSVTAGQRGLVQAESGARTETRELEAPGPRVQRTPDELPPRQPGTDSPRPPSGRLREIAVRLRSALRTLAYREKLARTKIISQEEVEGAKADVDILMAQLETQRDELIETLERLKAQIDVMRAEELVESARKLQSMNELERRKGSVAAQDEVKVRDGLLRVKQAELKALQVQVDQAQRRLDQAETLMREFHDPQP